jgi:CSLREA domain-containing protein
MKRLAVALLLLIALASGVVLLARPSAEASPATFTVNSTADPGDGTCDGTECTLREAIAAANTNAGTDTIEFNIPGVGPHTISPGSALPTITDPLIIDGSSEPDFAGTPITELDGSSAGASVDGLKITAGSSTVKGLVINRFDGDGIELSTNGGNVIEGNYIGIDVTGTSDLGNSQAGVYISSGSSNTIGGTAEAARNVISGNDGSAIWISIADDNVVMGNYIGIDASGLYAIGNNGGVDINEDADNNTVGGGSEGQRNVISGNGGGVTIGDSTNGNVVKGNYIGTDASGYNGIGNGIGVWIWADAKNSIIGGSTPGEDNVVAYNTMDGVRVQGATTTGNTISGNSIHSNAGKGIELADGGNTELAAPLIDSVVASASGHTDPKCYPCTVEIFSDSEDEGRIYHGSTTTNDDATGTWTYPGALTGPNVTATITDADDNTSEFSAPVAYSPPVGGIAKLPDISDSSASNYIALAALAGLALVALTAGTWYARRRWLRPWLAVHAEPYSRVTEDRENRPCAEL